jgi:hypothetical protein
MLTSFSGIVIPEGRVWPRILHQPQRKSYANEGREQPE